MLPLCALGAAFSVMPSSYSYAASPAPISTTTPSPLASSSPKPHDDASPKPSVAPQPKLTQQQKIEMANALTAYKATIQSALDGANKAIADARSIRDQALSAAPKDKNVRALAFEDFKRSSTQIWDAFRSSVAAAKTAYDAQVATIKSTR